MTTFLPVQRNGVGTGVRRGEARAESGARGMRFLGSRLERTASPSPTNYGVCGSTVSASAGPPKGFLVF